LVVGYGFLAKNPNPQSPIPQSPIPINKLILFCTLLIIN
jgi:hypothetical protein